MAYNEFTLAQLRQRFDLTTREIAGFYHSVNRLPVPPVLATILERQLPLAGVALTEKGKTELLVSPILVELKLQLEEKINLFSGVDFTVDPAVGLDGRCDFLMARGPSQLDVIAPVCMIVQAKIDDFLGGVPQALAEMIAARRFNEAAGTPINPIYGVVTSGFEWLFLQLVENEATIDLTRYSIADPGRIYAIPRAMALGEGLETSD